MVDSNNLDEVAKKQSEEETKRKPEDLYFEAVKHVCSTRQGRRFIWNILAKVGTFQNPFTGDNNRTNFNCGRQSIGTELICDVDLVAENAYALMIKESKEDLDDRPSANSGSNATSGSDQHGSPRTEQPNSGAIFDTRAEQPR